MLTTGDYLKILETCAIKGHDDAIIRALRYIDHGYPIMLYGPPGNGKTTIAEHLLTYIGGGKDTFYEIEGTEGMNKYHIIGGFHPLSMSGNSALAEQFVYKHGIVTRAIFDHKNLLIAEFTRAPSSAYSGLFMLLSLGKLPLKYRMRPERSGRRIAGFHRDYIPMESSEWLGREVSCTDAPSVFAKIAAIALLEATRDAKTRSLITFGADTRADINIPGDIDYGTLLAADGAGCCRLDLALASLLHIR